MPRNPEAGRPEGTPINWGRYVNAPVEQIKAMHSIWDNEAKNISKWEKYSELYGHVKERVLNVKVQPVPDSMLPQFTDLIGQRVQLRSNAPCSDEAKKLHGYVSNWRGGTNEVEVTFDNSQKILVVVEYLAQDITTKQVAVKNTTCIHCPTVLTSGKEHKIKGIGKQPYYICNSCYEARFFRCVSCTKHCATKNHAYKDPETNKRMCTQCYRQSYFCCDSCQGTKVRGDGANGRCSVCMHRKVNAIAHKSSSFNKTLGIDRFFGVEIETCCGDDDVVREEGWETCGDGSIHPKSGDIGIEYKTGVFQGNKGIQLLEQMCQKLAEKSHYVNNSCGLHVHVDCTNLTQDQLVNVSSFIRVFDNIIYSLMPRSRSKNDYCQKFSVPIRSIKDAKLAKINKLRHFGSMGRYRGFNLEAYQEHGTIEFRYHSGTINYHKIKNWILTCLLIIEKQKDNFWDERTRSLKACRRNLTKFFRYLDMPVPLQEYWISRYIAFNGKTKANKDDGKVVRTTQHNRRISVSRNTELIENLFDAISLCTTGDSFISLERDLTGHYQGGRITPQDYNELMRTVQRRREDLNRRRN